MSALPTRRDQVVLVTGGTRGLGKAIGLEFARTGAQVVLTHKWGNSDLTALAAEFERLDLRAPLICEADVADAEASDTLMQTIAERFGRLDVLISNVAFGKVAGELDELKRNSFELSLRYSAWPVVDLLQRAHARFGRYPRYVVGVSSLGVDIVHEGYDLPGAAKAVLETFCRYLALRLRGEGTRVNAIRPGFLDTDSSRATFGDAAMDRLAAQGVVLSERGAARACVALCSGYLDALTGQVLTVDEGWSLLGPLAFLAQGELPKPFPSEVEP